jgi:hypothetical protein
MEGNMKNIGLILLGAALTIIAFGLFKALNPAEKPVPVVAAPAAQIAPQPKWYTKDDPTMAFTAAVSPDTKTYCVAGTETWVLAYTDETKPDKVTSGPKIYLCAKGQEAARELAIPKIGGTNKYFRKADRPVFTKDGKNVIATLLYQDGGIDDMYVYAWDLKSGAAKQLFTGPSNICACDFDPAKDLPKKGTTANWYMTAKFSAEPKPKVEPHYIYLDHQEWSYGLDD